MSKFFTSDQLKSFQKPQYTALDRAIPKATSQLADWMSEEYGIANCDAYVLAKTIVPGVVREKQDAISPTAAEVYLPAPRVVDLVVSAAKAKAMAMDEQNELEGILAAHTNAEEHRKHDIF